MAERTIAEILGGSDSYVSEDACNAQVTCDDMRAFIDEHVYHHDWELIRCPCDGGWHVDINAHDLMWQDHACHPSIYRALEQAVRAVSGVGEGTA